MVNIENKNTKYMFKITFGALKVVDIFCNSHRILRTRFCFEGPSSKMAEMTIIISALGKTFSKILRVK